MYMYMYLCRPIQVQRGSAKVRTRVPVHHLRCNQIFASDSLMHTIVELRILNQLIVLLKIDLRQLVIP